MVHFFSEKVFFPILKKAFHLRTYGLEHIDPDCNYIFACNHRSALDYFIAMSAITPYTKRPTHGLVTHAYFKYPVIKNIFKSYDSIQVPMPNASGKSKCIDTAVSNLKKGNNILIFPEGKVGGAHLKKPLKAHTGVIRIALKSNTKIIPVGIENSYEAWKFNSRMNVLNGSVPHHHRYNVKRFPYAFLNYPYHFFSFDFKQNVKLKFGTPWNINGINIDPEHRSEKNKQVLTQLKNELMDKIINLSKKHYTDYN